MFSVLVAAFVLGFVAGLRSMLAPAALFLGRGWLGAGIALAVAAVAEFIGDVLPNTPPRTFLPAVLIRIASGAFVGWMLCAFRGAPPVAGGAAGVIGALVGTYGGKSVRLWLIARIGAIPAALAEDVVAIVLAVCVVVIVSPR